jgi:hypothetical protein
MSVRVYLGVDVVASYRVAHDQYCRCRARCLDQACGYLLIEGLWLHDRFREMGIFRGGIDLPRDACLQPFERIRNFLWLTPLSGAISRLSGALFSLVHFPFLRTTSRHNAGHPGSLSSVE